VTPPECDRFKSSALMVLTPVDEAGRFNPDYGWLHGQGTAESAEQIAHRLELSPGEVLSEELVDLGDMTP
jgi:hypothetical protein